MMMIERREILFDAEALLTVIKAMRIAADTFGLPRLPPEGVAFLPGEDQVEIHYGTAGQPTVVRLKAAAIGAMLMSFCLRARIPAPKAAVKGVRIEAEAAVLTFRMDMDKLPMLAGKLARPGSPPPGTANALIAPGPGRGAWNSVVQAFSLPGDTVQSTPPRARNSIP